MNKYINSPYEKKYSIEVKDHRNEDGDRWISLQEAPAYLGDDQVTGDTFTIDGQLPTTKTFGDEIYYSVPKSSSSHVEVKIHWEHRLDIMQQNLGLALFRYYLITNTDLTVTDYRIEEEASYVDIEAHDIAFRTVEDLENLVNYAITANLSIDHKKDQIQIEGLSSIDYKGPCLARTGEVGLFVIASIQRIDGKIRLYTLSGGRAFLDYREKTNILNHMMSYLNSKDPEQLFKDLKQLKSRQESLQKENKKMEKDLGLEEVREYKKLATSVDGVHYIFKVLRNVNFKDLKFISSHIMEDYNYVQIYGIPNGSRSQVLVVRSKNLSFNLKDIYDEIAKVFSLEGSGNIYIIQGNCNTSDLSGIMERFLLEIKKKIGEKK
ncbi:MAG: hypothetical protein Q4P25_02475 [Tissierellia bacterium]|nr:hypothetical protein [Tissierellia bacterium]